MRGKRFWIWSAVLLLLSFISLAWAQVDSKEYTSPDMSAKMKTAIEKSLQDEKFAEKTKETIKPDEEPGYLGIPGAPSPSIIAGFLWAIWVGWLFSTIGAFGGMMAGIGHITVFGLGPYGSEFGKGHPVNKLVVDSIRVSNQWLVGFSGLVSSINYYKMGRLVLPIALCLAIGGVGGSWLIPELTAGKISFSSYVGYFGIIVMVLGCFLLYELTPRGSSRKKEAKAAAKTFEQSVKEKKDSADKGVKLVEGNKTMMWLGAALVIASALWINLIPGAKIVAYVLCLAGWAVGFMIGTVRFTFYGVEFKFQAFLPVLGGILIAAIAAFLGIGGGFLFVPFMTSLVGLPMFVVAGTSTLCVFLGMIVSIFTYMVGKGILVSWGFIFAELVGIFVGSMIGPRTSKYIPDKFQKIFFVILAFYVGIRYASQGFLGYKILP
jgi:uncharacterized protein